MNNDQTVFLDCVIAALAGATTPRRDSEKEWDYRERVAQVAETLKVEYAAEQTALVKRLGELSNTTPIKGTVVGVAPSKGQDKRAVITLYTGTTHTSDGVPDGCEIFRTEWYTNARGAAQVHRARELMGHKVIAFKETVTSEAQPNMKVRMLRHLRDLGVDSDWEVEVDGKGRPCSARRV